MRAPGKDLPRVPQASFYRWRMAVDDLKRNETVDDLLRSLRTSAALLKQTLDKVEARRRAEVGNG